MNSGSEPWPSWGFVPFHLRGIDPIPAARTFLRRFLSALVLAFRSRCPSRDSWALSWRVIFVAGGMIYVLQGLQAQWVLTNVVQNRRFTAEELRCQIDNLQRTAPFDTELQRMLRVMVMGKGK